jgi:hypothetical protein
VKKTLVAAVLSLLLAACATERYYPVYLADGAGYYVAEREYGVVDPATRYDSLFAVGVYPWWVHTFYSPYFYPYYFTYYHPYYYPYYGPYHLAGWYPAWAGYASRYGEGWPPNWPSRGFVPGPDPSAGDEPPPVAGEPGRAGSGARALAREPYYRGPAPQRPAGLSPSAPQRVTAPVEAAVRARALMPGTSPAGSRGAFIPGGLSPGAPVGLPPAAAFYGRSPAAPVNQPVAPAAPGGPFPGEPVRIRPASSERVPAERDQ